jgi:PAS domain-containing protein
LKAARIPCSYKSARRGLLEVLFRALVFHASEPILLADNDRRYLEANVGASKLLGLPHNIAGRTLLGDAINEPTTARLVEEGTSTLLPGGLHHAERFLWRLVTITRNPSPDDAGQGAWFTRQRPYYPPRRLATYAPWKLRSGACRGGLQSAHRPDDFVFGLGLAASP